MVLGLHRAAGGVSNRLLILLMGCKEYVHCSEEIEDASGRYGCYLEEGLQEEMVLGCWHSP